MTKQSQLASLRSQAAAICHQKADYQAKIREIKEIYNHLQKIKGRYRTEKKSLNKLKNENSDEWTGNLYKTQFNQPVSSVISNELNITIKAIDRDMDRLIDKMNEYENKIFECDGLLGQIEIWINNLAGTIEKWFN